MHVLKSMPLLFLVLPLLLLLAPDQAWALQSHGPPEGIYVHQMAHIFYAAALCYLFWDLGRNAFPGTGWRYLQVFCLLMTLWNIVAFAGHWLGHYIANTEIVRPSGYFSQHLLGPFSAVKIIYFTATMDHVLSVPAMFFLFLCLRSLYHSLDKEQEK